MSSCVSEVITWMKTFGYNVCVFSYSIMSFLHTITEEVIIGYIYNEKAPSFMKMGL